MATTETPRDLFNQAMRFQCPGRTLATLGGIWPSTLERWQTEGLPALNSYGDLFDLFGFQKHIWTKPAASMFVFPAFERKVLAETADKITYVSAGGIVCTEFKKDHYKSMPHFESFPVTGRDDWKAFRNRLAWDPARIEPKWQERKAAWRSRTEPLILSFDRVGSLYGSLRDLMGVEALSFAFHDDPAMVEEMMDTVLELFVHLAEALLGDFVPDAVCLWEDMAYKTSTLLGAPMVRKFMLPRYRVMTACLRKLGVPLIFLDSDGYVDELIPVWLEAGIDGLVPMEAAAGMDVWTYRQKFPKLLMCGGVDKRALAAGRAAIDAEMDRHRRVIELGGLVPWFDHGLPHDASYANFLYFVEKLKEVCGA